MVNINDIFNAALQLALVEALKPMQESIDTLTRRNAQLDETLCQLQADLDAERARKSPLMEVAAIREAVHEHLGFMGMDKESMGRLAEMRAAEYLAGRDVLTREDVATIAGKEIEKYMQTFDASGHFDYGSIEQDVEQTVSNYVENAVDFEDIFNDCLNSSGNLEEAVRDVINNLSFTVSV